MPYKNKELEAAYKAKSRDARMARKRAFYKTPHGLELKRAWYQRHKEEILKKRAEYRAANLEAIAARKRAHYEVNRETILEKQKEYRTTHPEKVRATQRNNYLANKPKRNATSKAYYEANKEKLSKWQLDYNRKNKTRRNSLQTLRRSKNREHYRAKAREYANKRYIRDAEILRKRSREWMAAHPEKVSARKRSYRQNNRDKCYAANNKRLTAIQKATIGNVDEIKTLVTAWNSDPNTCCYYCAAPIYGTKFHIDHIIPISRGGAHHIDNLCPSCSLCNLSKHDKLVSEWRPELSAEPVGLSLS